MVDVICRFTKYEIKILMNILFRFNLSFEIKHTYQLCEYFQHDLQLWNQDPCLIHTEGCLHLAHTKPSLFHEVPDSMSRLLCFFLKIWNKLYRRQKYLKEHIGKDVYFSSSEKCRHFYFFHPLFCIASPPTLLLNFFINIKMRYSIFEFAVFSNVIFYKKRLIYAKWERGEKRKS